MNRARGNAAEIEPSQVVAEKRKADRFDKTRVDIFPDEYSRGENCILMSRIGFIDALLSRELVQRDRR